MNTHKQFLPPRISIQFIPQLPLGYSHSGTPSSHQLAIKYTYIFVWFCLLSPAVCDTFGIGSLIKQLVQFHNTKGTDCLTNQAHLIEKRGKTQLWLGIIGGDLRVGPASSPKVPHHLNAARRQHDLHSLPHHITGCCQSRLSWPPTNLI